MRVWYVTMMFPAPSETFASSDVRILRRLGIQVAVHSLRRAHPDSARLIAEQGVEDIPTTHNCWRATVSGMATMVRRPRMVIALLTWILLSNWRRPKHLLHSFVLTPRAFDLIRKLEQDPPEVVHLFWGHYPSIFGYLVRRYYPHIVVSIFLGAYDLVRGYGGSTWVARHADVVWTHAHANVDKICAQGVSPASVTVVHRGLDIDRLRVTAARKRKHLIVTAGRLIKAKGMDDALEVLAAVRSSVSDARMVVAGDGPERERLEALARYLGIESSVSFKGWLSQEMLMEELACAEVFLLMSRSESERLPNVVKEAMLNNCICVVTRTEGIDELVEHGRDGFLVEVGDIQAAANAIIKVWNSPDDAIRISKGAERRIITEFDGERQMWHYVSTWRNLMVSCRLC